MNQIARLLHLAVADWLTPENEGEPAPEGGWQSFGQEKNAASFSAFLDRLSGTENFKKDPDFKAQTALWLTELAKDRELRANTFAMATEATSRCEDRVTIALHDMKNVQLVHFKWLCMWQNEGRISRRLPATIAPPPRPSLLPVEIVPESTEFEIASGLCPLSLPAGRSRHWSFEDICSLLRELLEHSPGANNEIHLLPD
ncbi:hypothetical protein VK95_23435 [Leclercia sp. LK8]|nr:hypothetical protein VK95_23435 [Leclercia sp. LK8]